MLAHDGDNYFAGGNSYYTQCVSQLCHASPQQVAATTVPFVDPKRRIFSLALAPDYPLVACADSLGRVLIVDAANFVVTRVLKGYRDAETNWLYAPCDRALVLVVVAPRRKQVEVWDTFGGRKDVEVARRSKSLAITTDRSSKGR